MKNFLAIDTSNNHLAVLAAKNGAVHSVFLPDCAMKHSVSIMPAVDEALKKAEDVSTQQMSKITGGMNLPGLF